MGWAERLQPKDTEEVRPGVFIQKTMFGHRQVHPAAWDGKINWKNLIIGPNVMRNLIFFAIIVFMAWSYAHDTNELKGFYEYARGDPFQYCLDVEAWRATATCTVAWSKAGLCNTDEEILKQLEGAVDLEEQLGGERLVTGYP